MSKKRNIDIIQAFAGAVVSTFQQMCQWEVKPAKPFVKGVGTTVYGVSGVMGIAGDVAGVVVLTLQEQTAAKAISAFVGETFDTVDSNVIDGVKELTNIVVGQAKAVLNERGYSYTFSLPKVVVGYNYVTDQGDNSHVIVIPFQCRFGDFLMDIGIRGSAKG